MVLLNHVMKNHLLQNTYDLPTLSEFTTVDSLFNVLFCTVDWVADPVQSGFLPTPLCLNVLTRFDLGILHLKKK